MNFEIVGELADVETIATGRGVRELPRLRRLYGKDRSEENEGGRLTWAVPASTRERRDNESGIRGAGLPGRQHQQRHAE